MSAPIALLALVMLASSPKHRSQEPKPDATKITIPTPASPTIPNDAMFALGAQSGQLNSISGRMEKIETKLDGLQNDMTRINTIGGLLLIVVTAILAPIAVYRIQKRMEKPPLPLQL
jgi:hypothetical protein